MSSKKATIPVNVLITTQMQQLGMANAELAVKLGWEGKKANQVSMLKSGSFRLPLARVGHAAEALGIDPLYLTKLVNAEYELGLDHFIESLSKRTAVTLNEEKLIMAVREEFDGFDIDLDDHPQERAQVMSILSTVSEHARVNQAGILNQLEKNNRTAVSRLKRKQEAEDKGGRAAA